MTSIALRMFAHEALPDMFTRPTAVAADHAVKVGRGQAVVRRLMHLVAPSVTPIFRDRPHLIGKPRDRQPTASRRVPELDAFVFADYFVFDQDVEEAMCSVGNDGTTLLKPDDLDNPRIHVSPAILRAFPKLNAVMCQLGVVKSKKISFPEFVYHVVLGNPVVDGYCVVPLNQQKNDMRSANMRLLPGEGKNYRGTAIVARDDIAVGMYLPRGVTICLERLDKYFFFVKTSLETKKVGFPKADARRVYEQRVLPLMKAADPDFLVKDAVYQQMCASCCQCLCGARAPDLRAFSGTVIASI